MVKVTFGSVDGDYLIIEILGRSYPDSSDFGDGNWLNSKIIFSTGPFSGKIRHQLRTDEFQRFLPEVENLYKSLNGTAIYESMEDCLRIKMNGDGLGHIILEGFLADHPGGNNKLHFGMMLDQSYLKNTLKDLKLLCTQY